MTATADTALICATALRLQGAMLAAGAVTVEADILQPADQLLDLYGEDIRARAYVTHDPLRGELMLRPDFTVPVVQAHMTHGADPARYTYLGQVFRKQEHRASGAGGGDGDGPRPDGGLHGDGGRSAPRRDQGGTLPRQPQELRQSVEIRRSAPLSRRDHSGRG